MSEHKHTPGPWRVGTPGPNGCCTVGTERGLMTAMVAHSINEPDQAEQAKADAALIAAAPELLAALTAAVAFIESHVADPDITSEMQSAYATYNAAQPEAVLAKARGE